MLVIAASVTIATVNALSDFANQALQSFSLPDLLEPDPSNKSAPLLTSSVESGFTVNCNGAHFGHNLNLGDCQNAESYLAPGAELHTFAPRGTEPGRDFNPLPWRVMGDKAECFIQTIVEGRQPVGIASFGQIKRAAKAIILKCVSGMPSTGGVAINIGGDDNLAVLVAAFEPNVQCRGTFPTWQSCRDVLDDMPAGTDGETFGPPTDPAAGVHLPQQVESDDSRCTLRLFTKGASDASTWYRIWSAAVAVFSVCVRNRRGGSFRDLGIDQQLFITMTAQTGIVSNTSLIASA